MMKASKGKVDSENVLAVPSSSPSNTAKAASTIPRTSKSRSLKKFSSGSTLRRSYDDYSRRASEGSSKILSELKLGYDESDSEPNKTEAFKTCSAVAEKLWETAWSICSERFYSAHSIPLITFELRDTWLRIFEETYMDEHFTAGGIPADVFQPDEPPLPLKVDAPSGEDMLGAFGGKGKPETATATSKKKRGRKKQKSKKKKSKSKKSKSSSKKSKSRSRTKRSKSKKNKKKKANRKDKGEEVLGEADEQIEGPSKLTVATVSPGTDDGEGPNNNKVSAKSVANFDTNPKATKKRTTWADELPGEQAGSRPTTAVPPGFHLGLQKEESEIEAEGQEDCEPAPRELELLYKASADFLSVCPSPGSSSLDIPRASGNHRVSDRGDGNNMFPKRHDFKYINFGGKKSRNDSTNGRQIENKSKISKTVKPMGKEQLLICLDPVKSRLGSLPGQRKCTDVV